MNMDYNYIVKISSRIFLGIITIMFLNCYALSDVNGGAPVSLQAAMIGKLLGFYSNIPSPFTVYVIKDADAAKSFKELVGISKVTGVSEGSDLPDGKPGAIYFNDPAIAPKIQEYARKNKVLTMTGDPQLITNGVTLGIGLEDGKPKIMLNVVGSKEEGIDWNPAILKVAKTFN